jgi:PRTRC genetic system protein C
MSLSLGRMSVILKTYRRRRRSTDANPKIGPRLQVRRLTFPDPNPSLDAEGVRALYAATYPEIATAALTGPDATGDKLVYTFTKSVGTKG